MRIRPRLVAALLVCLAAVPACSTRPAQRPVTASPALVAAASRAIEDDPDTMSRAWFLGQAEHLLVQQCMHRLGQTYLVDDRGPQPPANASTADVTGTSRPPTYGIAWPGSGTSSVEDDYIAGLPTAARAGYVTVLQGPPGRTDSMRLPSGLVLTYTTGGCLGQARTQLYGSVAQAIEEQSLPQDVRVLIDAKLNNDRSYTATLRAWQRCMADAGWSFGSPAGAIEVLQTGTDGSTVFAARQTAIATADLSCDARTRLRARANAAMTLLLYREPIGILTDLAQLGTRHDDAYQTAIRLVRNHIRG